jgi:hypothetical protein
MFTNPSFLNRVIQYLRQEADCGIPVIVSMDTKPYLSYLAECPTVKIQTFLLERPEFLGDEITKFGDTWLLKDELAYFKLISGLFEAFCHIA